MASALALPRSSSASPSRLLLIVDVQSGRLWDSIELQPGERLGQQQTNFFQNPLSMTRTLIDTNMHKIGQLPSPQSFQIQRCLLTFNKFANPIDMYGIAESVVWSLYINQKMYLSAPIITMQTATLPAAPFRTCSYCQSVWVSRDRCPGCGAAQFTLLDIGEQDGLCFIMDIAKSPLVIEWNNFFRVELTQSNYAVKERLKMWFHLEGMHSRGVQ